MVLKNNTKKLEKCKILELFKLFQSPLETVKFGISSLIQKIPKHCLNIYSKNPVEVLKKWMNPKYFQKAQKMLKFLNFCYIHTFLRTFSYGVTRAWGLEAKTDIIYACMRMVVTFRKRKKKSVIQYDHDENKRLSNELTVK